MQRTVWRHFAVVLGLLLLYDLLWMVYGYGWGRHPAADPWRDALRDIGFRLPWIAVLDLPLAAGLALALLEFRRGALRTALTVVGLVLAIMVVFDIWVGPALRRAERAVAERAPGGTPAPLVLSDTAGVLQRAIALARHQVQVRDVAPKWRPPPSPPLQGPTAFAPVRDPITFIRMETGLTAMASINFFLPFVTAGLVLGLGAWTSRRVVFRQRRDERRFRVIAAWIVVFFVTGYLTREPSLGRSGVLTSGSVIWIFAPLLPALLVAALGWRAAVRAAEDAEL